MLSVSTGMRATTVMSGADLLGVLLEVGADALELGYQVKESTFLEMRPLIKRKGIRITSVHNFFPAPDYLPQGEGSGELHLFTSKDSAERRLAVEQTAIALKIAREVGARAVVLHLGKVPLQDPTPRLKTLYDQGKMGGEEARSYLEEMIARRSALSGPALEAAVSCLVEINNLASELGILVGIENRYGFAEVPNFEEFSAIFQEFSPGTAIGYWHDTGHAEANRNLGYGDPAEFLKSYGRRLIGMHLHDVVGGYRDHASPGRGTVDWGLIKRYLNPSVIRVLEFAPGMDVKEAREGISFLKRIGIK